MLKAVGMVVLGAVAGAGLGFLNQCAGGSCPLMCVWWRGALLGALVGLVIFLAGRPRGRDATRSR